MSFLTLLDTPPFTPRALFGPSTIGAIYAYYDYAYLYQKADGRVPVTALEQPVGLRMDERYGGAVSATELVDTANTAAAWTAYGTNSVTQDGSAVKITYVDNADGAYISLNGAGGLSDNVVVGRWYKVTFQAKVSTGAGVNINLSTTVSGTIATTVTATDFTTVTIRTSFTGTSPLMRHSASMGAGESIWIRNISVRELPGLHAYQATDAARHTLKGTPRYGLFDRVDDHLLVATGGGSTTGFMLSGSIQPASAGTARTIFSDRGTNTGYRVEIDASNNLLFTAGNGTAFTTCTGPALTAGTNYAFCVWHDGTNLNIKVGTAAVVQQAFATATAGTSTVTLFKDNAAASGYFSGRLYALTYIRNASITEGIASQLIGWAASKGGFAP